MPKNPEGKTKQKICDGKTVYTCTMEHIEEKGEVKHWHAINLEELKKVSNNNPPDFTFKIDRKEEKWPEECSCPTGCRRVVKDTILKNKKGWRTARRRVGAGGQVFELTIKTIIWREIEVKFVCIEVAEEKKVSEKFDPDVTDEEKAYALNHLEKELMNDFIENVEVKERVEKGCKCQKKSA